MPKDKSESHVRIVNSAREEILEKGFEKASMRSIAQKAGMTSAGLYRHFQDKEEMFASLVEPAISQLQEYLARHEEEEYHRLRKGDMDSIWTDDIETCPFRDVIYPNFRAFKLILCRSAGTRYERFVEGIVMLEEETTLRFLDSVRSQGLPTCDVRRKELHLLITAYITALTESVAHDFTLEETLHYIKTHQAFFKPGFRNVLGI